MNSESILLGAKRHVDPNLTPEPLHELIPIVRQWAFSRLEDQDSYVTLMLREQPEQVAFFNSRVDQVRDAIVCWGKELGYSLPGSHPYFCFLDVLKVRELTESPHSDLMRAARIRVAEEVREYKLKEALATADELFRAKNYQGYIMAIEPFEELLDSTQKAKLQLARKRN